MKSSPSTVSVSYPMFIEPLVIRVPLRLSGYIWLDNIYSVELNLCKQIPKLIIIIGN